MSSGTFYVKGFAYQDIVAILMRNNYDVTVVAEADNDVTNATYQITYKFHRERVNPFYEEEGEK